MSPEGPLGEATVVDKGPETDRGTSLGIVAVISRKHLLHSGFSIPIMFRLLMLVTGSPNIGTWLMEII